MLSMIILPTRKGEYIRFISTFPAGLVREGSAINNFVSTRRQSTHFLDRLSGRIIPVITQIEVNATAIPLNFDIFIDLRRIGGFRLL